jgi:uncharacterized protein (DUF2147 family)
MRGFRHLIAAAIMALTSLPATAGDLNPDGYWITEGQKARYLVTSCGEGALCAILLWIRPDLRTERNTKYVNTAIFENLPRQGEASWRGEVTLEGRTFNGVVEMVNADQMKVTGCVFILCDTVMMSRLPGNV